MHVRVAVLRTCRDEREAVHQDPFRSALSSARTREAKQRRRVSRKVERPRSITKRERSETMARSAASFVKPVPRRAARCFQPCSNTVPFETVENREKKEWRVALFGKQKLLLEIINSPKFMRHTLRFDERRRDSDTYYFLCKNTKHPLFSFFSLFFLR